MVDETPGIVESNADPKSMNHLNQPAVDSKSSIDGLSSNEVKAKNILSDVKIKREPATDVDTVYGTYDEATNCITIIYPGENDNIQIQESVQEVSTEDVKNNIDEPMSEIPAHHYTDHMSPYTYHDSLSPSSIHSDDSDSKIHINKIDSSYSDKGYESHGSPFDETNSVQEGPALTDLWHESFSELFPSLA